MNDEERLVAVEGCRFVDEVVRDVPYVMNEEYLVEIMERYKIDFVVHGDDPCIVNGKVRGGEKRARGKAGVVRRAVVTTVVWTGRVRATSEDGQVPHHPPHRGHLHHRHR